MAVVRLLPITGGTMQDLFWRFHDYSVIDVLVECGSDDGKARAE